MKNLSRKLLIFPVLFLLVFNTPIYSQEPTIDEEVISVDTLLLNVPVTVGDRDGRYVSGLKKENFYTVENGVKRPVDFFADAAAPMNVAILIDTSYSTKKILGDIKEAARNFIGFLRPGDKAMIASFDSTTRVWSEFTSDPKKLTKALSKIDSQGNSIMYDAICLLMEKHFAPIQGRKAIIVLTDGSVTGAMISENKLINALSESDIMVYPLLFDLPFFKSAPTLEALQSIREFGISRMSKFSLVTGGKVFHSGETNFKIAFQQISDELKKQYVIGFYPSDKKGDMTFRIGMQFDPKLFNPQNIVLRTKRVITFKSRASQKNIKN